MASLHFRCSAETSHLARLLHFFVALLYLCSVFVQKALGYTVQGWATIMVGMLFLGGVQLISLGIIGEYVGGYLTRSSKGRST